MHNAHSNDIRLPKNITPNFYDLRLTLDLETCTFNGNAVIDFVVNEETPVITLHAEGLAIRKAEYVTGKNAVAARAFGTDFKREGLMIHFPRMLPCGNAKLILEFEGAINNQMTGCYQSFYAVNGARGLMATTQF